MTVENLILEEIGELNEKLSDYEIGTVEYNAIANERNKLMDKAIEIEKGYIEADLKRQQIEEEIRQFDVECERKQQQANEEKKDRRVSIVLEGVKIVGGGIVLPVLGLVYITAKEENISYVGALRDFTKLFIPKKI